MMRMKIRNKINPIPFHSLTKMFVFLRQKKLHA
jgi:hypothetical protein